ncbi:hypothetical protein [Kineosporia sp. NBRC 101731]|uniref:hypothetical protein n=1 Tax=Kineosporia sp. NBRC 101731 TaxID=3032199 RepID=UPI0024A47FD6|nr:hypothetical protein [Kineosporia sp. NBRC 101731]GLY30430.1 hypothetical protein Kisp02_37950 [Kineosporia sp. NBRC 101731]
MTRSGPAQGFSLCNPDNDRPSDLPRLLRRLADRLDDLDLDPVEILDMTVHQETTGDGPRWWATVYFSTEGPDSVDLTSADLTETADLFSSAELREHTDRADQADQADPIARAGRPVRAAQPVTDRIS